MPAARIHLVRHGEVHNPDRVLYGRLPGFHLSDDGHRMARAAAEHLKAQGRPVRSLVSSPLERARESAAPIAETFGLTPVIDARVIEPTNVFEGRRMRRALRNPLNWWHLRTPALPSWGEAYLEVVERMQAAMRDAWNRTASGDAVIVSHQLPIWITHLSVAGLTLRHDPRVRRCDLSSITSFELVGDVWREVAYVEPAATAGAVDVGAV